MKSRHCFQYLRELLKIQKVGYDSRPYPTLEYNHPVCVVISLCLYWSKMGHWNDNTTTFRCTVRLTHGLTHVRRNASIGLVTDIAAPAETTGIAGTSTGTVIFTLVCTGTIATSWTTIVVHFVWIVAHDCFRTFQMRQKHNYSYNAITHKHSILASCLPTRSLCHDRRQHRANNQDNCKVTSCQPHRVQCIIRPKTDINRVCAKPDWSSASRLSVCHGEVRRTPNKLQTAASCANTCYVMLLCCCTLFNKRTDYS